MKIHRPAHRSNLTEPISLVAVCSDYIRIDPVICHAVAAGIEAHIDRCATACPRRNWLHMVALRYSEGREYLTQL